MGTTISAAAAGAAATQAQSSNLLATAQGDADSRDAKKIEKAGRDFESILLGSWLQGAEQSFAAAPGGNDEDDDDGSRGQFLGMAMQQLAGSIVDAGGIGIARMISEHLEQMSSHKSNSPVGAKKSADEEHGLS